MIGVNEVFQRRSLDHDAKPAERVGSFKGSEHTGWNGLSAWTVETVAAGDEVAIDPAGFALMHIGDVRVAAVDIMERHVPCLIDDVTAVSFARGIEVFGDRGLAPGHHLFAGPSRGVDEEIRLVLPDDRRAVLRLSIPVHALAEAKVTQQLDRACLQHPGTNARQNVGLALPLEHDVVDANEIEHVGKQQACRPTADDHYPRPLIGRLRAHMRVTFSFMKSPFAGLFVQFLGVDKIVVSGGGVDLLIGQTSQSLDLESARLFCCLPGNNQTIAEFQ